VNIIQELFKEYLIDEFLKFHPLLWGYFWWENHIQRRGQ